MSNPADAVLRQASVEYSQPAADCLLIRLAGIWTLKSGIPPVDEFSRRVAGHTGVRHLQFDGSGITEWDTSLLAFLRRLVAQAGRQGMVPELDGLPDGVRRLLDLAAAVPPKVDAGRREDKASVLAQIGNITLEGAPETVAMKKATITETTGGKKYRDIVAAQSRALAGLSREIAAAIRAAAASRQELLK